MITAKYFDLNFLKSEGITELPVPAGTVTIHTKAELESLSKELRTGRHLPVCINVALSPAEGDVTALAAALPAFIKDWRHQKYLDITLHLPAKVSPSENGFLSGTVQLEPYSQVAWLATSTLLFGDTGWDKYHNGRFIGR